MPDTFDIDVVTDLAIQVGARVAREYPGIDAEDVAQEAVTALYEKADRLANVEPDYLYTVMYEAGNTYAAKERYDYIVATSAYIYRPKEVRALLEESYFQPSSHDVPTSKDQYLSAEIDRGTVFASIMDIQTAWKRLSGAHQDVLYRRFRDGLEVTDTKAVTRAVDALTRAMNIHINRQQDAGGPGARTAMSNAQAQHRTRHESGCEGEPGTDAVDEYQTIRSRQSAPAGSYFNWGSK